MSKLCCDNLSNSLKNIKVVSIPVKNALTHAADALPFTGIDKAISETTWNDLQLHRLIGTFNEIPLESAEIASAAKAPPTSNWAERQITVAFGNTRFSYNVSVKVKGDDVEFRVIFEDPQIPGLRELCIVLDPQRGLVKSTFPQIREVAGEPFAAFSPIAQMDVLYNPVRDCTWDLKCVATLIGIASLVCLPLLAGGPGGLVAFLICVGIGGATPALLACCK